MHHKDSTLILAIYHPKPGYENEFIKIWDEKVYKLAMDMGCDQLGMYHNEETEEFFATGHWSNKKAAEKFLASDALKEHTKELNKFCLVPASRETFDMLREAAA